MSGGGGISNLIQQAMSQLPPNLQNYSGGPSYPGMQQDAQPFGTPGAGSGSYNQLAGDMSQNRFGQSSFSPTSGFAYAPYQPPAPQPWMGGGSWPGFGMGGMPGRFGNPSGQGFGGYRGGGYGGAFGGGGFGFGGGGARGNMYGPGAYRSPGSMPYGGGSGLATTGGSPNPFLSFPGQAPRSVQPAQQVHQYLNYRSPYSGGGQMTQYGPQQQKPLDPMANAAGGGTASW